MEALFQYFLKVNGLLIVFYLSYYIFLRKETFFQNNRWFLLLGIITSIVLPLITFTEIIWVNPEPVLKETAAYFPINITSEAISVPFDWNTFFMYCYFLVSTSFLFKLVLELYSFFKIVKNGNQIKEKNIVLVETNELQNPFSFFNYLVFNKSNFTEEELSMIIIHERIHIEQKHSIDVLISKLLCLFLWINPITWLYRKAILENLEFIADNQTAVITNKAYQYQKTLLKVVVCNNQLSITNQFYQSLIKKRIVMLNTNQSSKKNVWKYAVVFPLLVAFMLFFQVETVAQVKEKSKNSKVTLMAVGYGIDKNATDAEMKSDSEELKKQGIDYKFSKVKRNKKGEIIAIKIEFNDKKGNKGVKEVKGDEPIEPIYFNAENNNIGFTNPPDLNGFIVDEKLSKQFGTEVKVKKIKTFEVKNSENGENSYIINGDEFTKTELKNNKIEIDESNKRIYIINEEKVSKNALDNLDPQNIKSMDVNKSGNENIIRVITKNSAGIPDDTEIYINGEKVSKEEFDELEQSEIQMMNIKEVNSKKIIEIQTKINESPKNRKLTFSPNKKYIINGESRKYDELKDKNWFLFTGTPHKIEEKNNVVTITGDIVIDADKYKTQEVIYAIEPEKIETKKIYFENGIQLFIHSNGTIKIPKYPTYSLSNLKIEVDGKEIKNTFKAFNKYDGKSFKKVEVIEANNSTSDNVIIKKLLIKTK